MSYLVKFIPTSLYFIIVITGLASTDREYFVLFSASKSSFRYLVLSYRVPGLLELDKVASIYRTVPIIKY